MPLTDTKIKTTKPGPKTIKLSDGGGLFIAIEPRGTKLWRIAYRFDRKQKLLALGAYPTVTLAAARTRRDDAKRLLAEGVDPGAARKADKVAARVASTTFRDLGEDWYEKKLVKEGKGERTLERARWLLSVLYVELGELQPDEIEPPKLLETLRKAEAKGHHETSSRMRSTASRVFRFGIAEGRCRRDPAADLRGALTAPQVKHRPAILHPVGIGALMRAVAGYDGSTTIRLGLQLLALTFTRPGELRLAAWEEFDLEARMWCIPAGRMKMRREHLVPLSHQAVALFKDLHELTGKGGRLFPSITHRDRPISENSLNAALRRLGYSSDEMVAHGFRAMASTRLREMNKWLPEVIERQLAHVEANSVRRAYNRAEYLPQRVEIMQTWADYLDDLRDQGASFRSSHANSPRLLPSCEIPAAS